MKKFIDNANRTSYQILTRGRSYFYQKKTNLLWYKDNKADFLVCGHESRPYKVHLEFDENKRLKVHSCSCPYNMTSMCKHVVACLYALDDYEEKHPKIETEKPASMSHKEEVAANKERRAKEFYELMLKDIGGAELAYNVCYRLVDRLQYDFGVSMAFSLSVEQTVSLVHRILDCINKDSSYSQYDRERVFPYVSGFLYSRKKDDEFRKVFDAVLNYEFGSHHIKNDLLSQMEKDYRVKDKVFTLTKEIVSRCDDSARVLFQTWPVDKFKMLDNNTKTKAVTLEIAPIEYVYDYLLEDHDDNAKMELYPHMLNMVLKENKVPIHALNTIIEFLLEHGYSQNHELIIVYNLLVKKNLFDFYETYDVISRDKIDAVHQKLLCASAFFYKQVLKGYKESMEDKFKPDKDYQMLSSYESASEKEKGAILNRIKTRATKLLSMKTKEDVFFDYLAFFYHINVDLSFLTSLPEFRDKFRTVQNKELYYRYLNKSATLDANGFNSYEVKKCF